MMRPEIIVPLLMGCALLWWIGRSLSGMARLGTIAVTLVIVIAVLLAEQAVR